MRQSYREADVELASKFLAADNAGALHWRALQMLDALTTAGWTPPGTEWVPWRDLVRPGQELNRRLPDGREVEAVRVERDGSVQVEPPDEHGSLAPVDAEGRVEVLVETGLPEGVSLSPGQHSQYVIQPGRRLPKGWQWFDHMHQQEWFDSSGGVVSKALVYPVRQAP